jgi:hypothetical protein
LAPYTVTPEVVAVIMDPMKKPPLASAADFEVYAEKVCVPPGQAATSPVDIRNLGKSGIEAQLGRASWHWP